MSISCNSGPERFKILDVHKIYLHFKHPFEPKYQSLINGEKNVVYEDLGDYNSTKKRKVSIVFDDMIANMEAK